MGKQETIYENMICITNRHLYRGDFLEKIDQIAEKRPAAIILREKDLPEEEYEQLLLSCQKICRDRVPLYAHTYLEAAVRAEVSGIHLPLPILRDYVLSQDVKVDKRADQSQQVKQNQMLKPNHAENSAIRPGLRERTGMKMIGASIHSVTEALEAQQLGASYVTAGHVFATDCKKGVPGRGLTFLKKVCEAVSIPVYALGGMNEGNLKLVMKMGAAGSCMMSGFMKE